MQVTGVGVGIFVGFVGLVELARVGVTGQDGGGDELDVPQGLFVHDGEGVRGVTGGGNGHGLFRRRVRLRVG